MTLRLFIALDLDHGQKQEAGALIGRLKGYLPQTRWVKKEAMHLTLAFIGEAEAGIKQKIEQAMASALKSFTPFYLALKGAGVFPGPHKARVIWLGIGPGEQEATALAEALRGELASADILKDRKPFKAHLTLGRLRSPLPQDLIERFLAEEGAFQGSQALVREAVLYHSELTESGALYRPLNHFRLSS